MRINKALIIRTLGENFSSGEQLINELFYKIDIKDHESVSILANKESKHHNWLDGIEYIKPEYFENNELGLLTKIRANEALEITQSIYSLLDRVQMHYQVKGLIVLNNLEIKNFLKRSFKEFDKIKRYEEIQESIDEVNQKIKDLKKELKTLRSQRTTLSKNLKLIEKSAKKEKDEKILNEKIKIESSIKDIAEQIKKDVEEMNKLDSKLSDLKVLSNQSKPLIYNLFSDFTSIFNLMSKYEIVAINNDYDLVVLNIGNKKEDSLLSVKGLSSFVKDIKNKIKDDKKISQIIFNQWEKTDPIDFKIKLNSLSSRMAKEKTFFEIEDEGMLKHQVDILAPVKPTIAAAMLASGSTGSFSHEIPIEGENCLIKTVISPVIKVSKEISSKNGEETTVTIKTWEPRLGIFNKTRKSFKILTQ